MNLDIEPGSVPDSVPTTTGTNPDWYDQDYPYSTEEHPYGFFPLEDGTPDFGRPRKRRPKGSGGGGTKSSTSAKPSGNARQAARLLAQMNMFVGMGIMSFGFIQTAEQLKAANAGFEEMAYDALVNDPALCKKILSAGASSGKSQLVMAYAMLGVAIVPVAMTEAKSIRGTIEGDVE